MARQPQNQFIEEQDHGVVAERLCVARHHRQTLIQAGVALVSRAVGRA